MPRATGRSLLLAVPATLLVVALCSLHAGSRQKAAAGEASVAGPAKTAPQTQKPAPPPEKKLWMVAVGDVMLDRNVGKRIKENGYASILEKVRDQLRAPSLTFCNLECPLSTEGPHDPKNCCFRADPATVKVLTDGGFDIVSLANNHSLNAGREGVLQTLDTLDKASIPYVGAHRDRARGLEPVSFHLGNTKVGFMALTDLSFDHGSYAKLDRDPEAALDAVRDAAGQCDLLFVSVHWGEEYEKMPRDRQERSAERLIDAGADCILGHHPHTLQGIGVYKSRPILYSMGNFVFDQREGERMESAIFDLRWSETGGWKIKATPIWIPRDRLGPIYPSRERALKTATRLRDITRALGTDVALEGSRVLVNIGGKQNTGPAKLAAPTSHEPAEPTGEYKEPPAVDE